MAMTRLRCRKGVAPRMDYAVISPEYLYMMADFFRSVVGSLFSVGIYIVIILLGLDIFLKFVFSIVD